MNEVVIGAVKEVAKGAAVHLNYSTMNWPGAAACIAWALYGAFDSYMKYGNRNAYRRIRKVHNAEFTRKYQTQLS